MKKIIIAGLVIVAICSVVLIISSHGSATTHSIDSVTTAVFAGSRSSGTSVLEGRSISGRLRGGRLHVLTRWIGNVIGRETFDDIDEFLVKGGMGEIRIIVYHRNGQVGQIEIVPDAHSSPTASVIRTEILSALPGIKCTVEKP